MTDLTREQIEALLDDTTPGNWLASPDGNGEWGVDTDDGWGIATVAASAGLKGDNGFTEGNARLIAADPDLARTVIALHAQLANVQAAQAMAYKAADRECRRAARTTDSPNAQFVLYKVADAIRDFAPIDGLALVRELRADADRLNRWRAEEGEKIKRQAKALTDLTKHCQRIEAENAGLARKIGKVQRGDGDHSQIADLEAKVINQRNELANLRARDGRLAELAVERDTLAAANVALEAKVARLAEAAEDAEYDLLQWLECSKALTAAGFNMDGTAEVTAKLTAALSHIKRGKTNG